MTAAPTIESPAYFARLADVEARHWWSRGMWRLAECWLHEALRGRAGLSALDVGCGTGLTARRMAGLPEVREVVGLDPSEEALSFASTRFDGPLVRGSALELPFASSRFDVLTCFDVIQHVPAAAAVRELRRVVAPGGVLIVRSNGRGWSGDAASFRLGELVALLSRGGFRVRRATYANMLPALVQEARGAMSRKAGAGHPSGGGLQIRVPSPRVNAVMARVSITEAWAAGRLGVRLPFGHSTLVWAEPAAG